MKNYILVYILLLINTYSFGQNSNKILFCNDVRDSIFKFEEIKAREKFYKINSIENIKEEFVFRSWAGNSCVEIIKNNQNLSGRIYFATKKYSKNKKNSNIFTESYELSLETVEKLYLSIIEFTFTRQIHPSGETPTMHIFEIKQDSNVEIYTTDNPTLRTLIFQILPMNSLLDKFEKNIPFKKFVDWDFLDIEGFYGTKENG